MTKQEFMQQMEVLTAVYGQKHYPLARIERLYGELKALPADRFKRIVDELVLSEPYAPLLPKFAPHVSKWREEQHQAFRRDEKRTTDEFLKGRIMGMPNSVKAQLAKLYGTYGGKTEQQWVREGNVVEQGHRPIETLKGPQRANMAVSEGVL